MTQPTNQIQQALMLPVLNDYIGINRLEATNSFSMKCPFHNDTSENSMRVYPETNSMYCFGGCGSFRPESFVAKLMGITHGAARLELQKKYNLVPLTAEEEAHLQKMAQLVPYIEATHHHLTEEKRQQLRDRGLTDAFIDNMQIGYHPPEDFQGPSDEQLIELGIYRRDQQGGLVSDFVEKITVPLYRNEQLVEVVAWNADNIEGEPKYSFPMGGNRHLCGTSGKNLFLVEGVFDLLSFSLVGLPAMSGMSASLSKAQIEELKPFESITIAFDGDEAGRQAAKKLAMELYPKARILSLTNGEDPNSVLQDLGVEGFRDYFLQEQAQAEDLLDAQLDVLRGITKGLEAAKHFQEQCLPLLSKKTDIECEAILQELRPVFKQVGITKKSITTQLKEIQKQDQSSTGNGGGDSNQATELYQHLSQSIQLYLDDKKVPYARIPVKNHHELVPVDSQAFKRYVRKEGRDYFDKIANTDAITQVVKQFESDAHYLGLPAKLRNRVGWDGKDILYDMANVENTVIRVTANGWEIDESCPPVFKREEHQHPQVFPLANGNLESLFQLLHVTDEQKVLLGVWLVYCLVPDVPKVILYVQAEKGSGKTEMTKALRKLIDPSAVETLKEPNHEDRLVNQLYHHYLPVFDNINYMKAWFIRLCCTTATGESDERRKLFTDDGAVIFQFVRPIIINAINRLAIEFPDFQDRTLLHRKSRIAEEDRIEQAVFWERFEEMRPAVFGAMLDALSKAMAIKPSIQLNKTPRMADFAHWGCAIAEALGYGKDVFLEAYYQNMEMANEETILDHPIAQAIAEFMSTQQVWDGTATELLEALEDIAIDLRINTNEKVWAKSPSVLTRRLNEIRSNLLDVGIEVDIPPQAGGKRKVIITKRTAFTKQTLAVDNRHESSLEQGEL